MASLKPAPGYVLVELGSKYKNVSATTKSYDGATTGVVKAMNVTDREKLDGLQVYWEELVTGTRVIRGEHTYSFVKISSIVGYDE